MSKHQTDGVLKRVYWPSHHMVDNNLPAHLIGRRRTDDRGILEFIITDITTQSKPTNVLGTLLPWDPNNETTPKSKSSSSSSPPPARLHFHIPPSSRLPCPLPPNDRSNYQIILYTNLSLLNLHLSSSSTPSLIQEPPIVTSTLIVHLSGLAIGLNILLHRHTLATTLTTLATHTLPAIIQQHMTWFQTAAPAGIKLHETSCRFLGRVGCGYVVHAMIPFYSALLSTDVSCYLPHFLPSSSTTNQFSSSLCIICTVAVVLMSLGLKRGLAVCVMTIRLLSLPIILPNIILSAVLQLHLKALSVAWNATRGRLCQQNMSDKSIYNGGSRWRGNSQATYSGGITDDLLSWSPVAGMLLLIPLLLLLPTTYWWWGYAACWACCAALSEGFIIVLLRLVEYKPLRRLVNRIVFPRKFILGVDFEYIRDKEKREKEKEREGGGNAGNNKASYVRLKPRIRGLGEVFRACLETAVPKMKNIEHAGSAVMDVMLSGRRVKLASLKTIFQNVS